MKERTQHFIVKLMIKFSKIKGYQEKSAKERGTEAEAQGK